MAETVELFFHGLSMDDARRRIDACTGLVGEVDDDGIVNYSQPDFLGRLRSHRYADDGDLDFTAYELELTAKNYWTDDEASSLDTETVGWFRRLFGCLAQQSDVGLLLTYNLDYFLDRSPS